MKLSAYHKSRRDHVEWYQPDVAYDIVYMSRVFNDEYSTDIPEPTNADKVIKGGTGYAIKPEDGKEVYHKELDPPLPPEVESMYPDYSLYPQYTGWHKLKSKQTAFGYLTRGCPWGCEFCHVAAKEGKCTYKVADVSQFWRGQRHICLNDPNILAYSFALVVFDPPHITNLTETSWMRKSYGSLDGNWQEMIRKGFRECMRVLKPDGVLVFKWSDISVSTREILNIIGEEPLFGHRSGKKMNTHWMCFMKLGDCQCD